MRKLIWVGLVALLIACGDDTERTVDGAIRDRRDAEIDADMGTDEVEDAAIEAGPDTPDAEPDAEPDANPPDAAPDGTVDCADTDRDGAYDAECGGDDCNDADPAVHPSARELCGNAIDDDCDDATLDLRDADGDGFTCVADCNDDDALEPMTSGACAGVVYATDFEAGPQGWTTSFDSAYGKGESSWALGMPSKFFLDTVASGENAWVTSLTGKYNDNERSYLTSPVIDMSLLSDDPVLMISLTHSTDGGDFLWVEREVNGGEFVRVGKFGEGFNWYTQGNAWAGLSEGFGDVWQTAFHRLEGTKGRPKVRIRFVFQSNTSVTDEGFGIDDVRVLASLPDVSIQAFENPPAICQGENALEVGVDVHNRGNETFSTLTLAYQVNDGSEVVETFDVNLLPGDTRSLFFSEAADISAPDQYRIAVSVADERDAFAQDDRTETAITTMPAIRVDDAYREDFESDDGGWFPYGEDAQWHWGVPDDPYVSSAASGYRAWYTRVDPLAFGELSFLQSPCFDLSGLTADPILHMRHKYRYTEYFESNAFMQLSTNGGLSWSKLGEQGSGSNWYTSEDGWSAPSNTRGEWRTASQRLVGTAGKSSTVLRIAMEHALREDPSTGIDDVQISRRITDLEVEAAQVEVEVGCSTRDDDVLVVNIRNRGDETVNELDVSYSIDDGPAVTERVTMGVAPLGSYRHAFQLGNDLAAIGPHAIEVTVSAMGDAIPSNDSMIARSWTQQVVDGLGYDEGFELDDGRWQPTGPDPAWRWLVPDGLTISSAASGDRAWVASGVSGFAVLERSWLTSPCFDFTAAASDPTFRFKHVVESDGYAYFGWLDISVDGGASFVRVGNFGTGTWWYDGSDDRWDGSAEFSDSWHTAAHALADVAGKAAVLVRFGFEADTSFGESGYDGQGVDDVEIVP